MPCFRNSGTADESLETDAGRSKKGLDFPPARPRMPTAGILQDVGEGALTGGRRRRRPNRLQRRALKTTAAAESRSRLLMGKATRAARAIVRRLAPNRSGYDAAAKHVILPIGARLRRRVTEHRDFSHLDAETEVVSVLSQQRKRLTGLVAEPLRSTEDEANVAHCYQFVYTRRS
ncbi:hypothetical protein HPB51_007716 [Rhipicephalus microplus]|uniref:Uncharacterized protein n=1 Tax=Rhipicephalus microplus TaxID=6941 RepID=A0A9J6DTR2_RHIMP|nr:hypothetical protein HPB51_007716 [Rhipicephalus microplus]